MTDSSDNSYGFLAFDKFASTCDIYASFRCHIGCRVTFHHGDSRCHGVVTSVGVTSTTRENCCIVSSSDDDNTDHIVLDKELRYDEETPVLYLDKDGSWYSGVINCFIKSGTSEYYLVDQRENGTEPKLVEMEKVVFNPPVVKVEDCNQLSEIPSNCEVEDKRSTSADTTATPESEHNTSSHAQKCNSGGQSSTTRDVDGTRNDMARETSATEKATHPKAPSAGNLSGTDKDSVNTQDARQCGNTEAQEEQQRKRCGEPDNQQQSKKMKHSIEKYIFIPHYYTPIVARLSLEEVSWAFDCHMHQEWINVSKSLYEEKFSCKIVIEGTSSKMVDDCCAQVRKEALAVLPSRLHGHFLYSMAMVNKGENNTRRTRVLSDGDKCYAFCLIDSGKGSREVLKKLLEGVSSESCCNTCWIVPCYKFPKILPQLAITAPACKSEDVMKLKQLIETYIPGYR